MKNQALLVTIAVTVVITLGALAALVVSSDRPTADAAVAITVAGADTSVAAPTADLVDETSADDTTTPIGTDDENEDNGSPDAVDGAETTVPDAPVDPSDGFDDTGVAVDNEAEDDQPGNDAEPTEPAEPGNNDAEPTEPAEPGNNDAQPTEPAEPGNNDAQPTEPAEPGNNDAEPTEPAEPGDDDVPAEPGDDDVPAEPGDDDVLECPDGELIDDVCVVTPIHCLLGYDFIDGSCVFTGCPAGHQLTDAGFCEALLLQLPCPPGQHRVDGVCTDIFILDPGVLLPFCPQGQHIEDGVCVPDFLVDPGLVIPGLDLISPDLATTPDVINPGAISPDLGVAPSR